MASETEKDDLFQRRVLAAGERTRNALICSPFLNLTKLDSVVLPLRLTVRIAVLNHNQLRTIEPLRGARSLEKLDLSHNQIRALPSQDFWASLENLKVLYLNDNRILTLSTLALLRPLNGSQPSYVTDSGEKVPAPRGLVSLRCDRNPASQASNYRRFVVKCLKPSILCLDGFVVADEEYVPGLHFYRLRDGTTRVDVFGFGETHHSRKIGTFDGDDSKSYPIHREALMEELGKIEQIHRKLSPVQIIQRLYRGYAVRRLTRSIFTRRRKAARKIVFAARLWMRLRSWEKRLVKSLVEGSSVAWTPAIVNSPIRFSPSTHDNNFNRTGRDDRPSDQELREPTGEARGLGKRMRYSLCFHPRHLETVKGLCTYLMNEVREIEDDEINMYSLAFDRTFFRILRYPTKHGIIDDDSEVPRMTSQRSLKSLGFGVHGWSGASLPSVDTTVYDEGIELTYDGLLTVLTPPVRSRRRLISIHGLSVPPRAEEDRMFLDKLPRRCLFTPLEIAEMYYASIPIGKSNEDSFSEVAFAAAADMGIDIGQDDESNGDVDEEHRKRVVERHTRILKLKAAKEHAKKRKNDPVADETLLLCIHCPNYRFYARLLTLCRLYNAKRLFLRSREYAMKAGLLEESQNSTGGVNALAQGLSMYRHAALLRLSAAVTIQKAWRNFRDRLHLRFEANFVRRVIERRAAIVIQGWWRFKLIAIRIRMLTALKAMMGRIRTSGNLRVPHHDVSISSHFADFLHNYKYSIFVDPDVFNSLNPIAYPPRSLFPEDRIQWALAHFREEDPLQLCYVAPTVAERTSFADLLKRQLRMTGELDRKLDFGLDESRRKEQTESSIAEENAEEDTIPIPQLSGFVPRSGLPRWTKIAIPKAEACGLFDQEIDSLREAGDVPPLRATLSSGAVIEYADRHFGKKRKLPRFLPCNRWRGYYWLLFATPQEFVIRLACLFLRTWHTKNETSAAFFTAQEVLTFNAASKLAAAWRGCKARKLARTLRRAKLLELSMEETERLEAFGKVEKGHPVPSSLGGNGVFLPFGRRISLKRETLEGYHKQEMQKLTPRPPAGEPSYSRKTTEGEGQGQPPRKRLLGSGKVVPPLALNHLQMTEQSLQQPHSAPTTLRGPLFGADTVLTPSCAMFPTTNASAHLGTSLVSNLPSSGVEIEGTKPFVATVRDIEPEPCAQLSARGTRREKELVSQFRLKENQIDYAQKRKLWEAERTREKELAGEVPFVMEANRMEVQEFANQKRMELQEMYFERSREDQRMKEAVESSRRRHQEIQEMMVKSKEEAARLISARAQEEKSALWDARKANELTEKDSVQKLKMRRDNRLETKDVRGASREFVGLLARQHNYLGKRMLLDKIEDMRQRELKELRQQTQSRRLMGWKAHILHLKTKTGAAAAAGDKAREMKRRLKEEMEVAKDEVEREIEHKKSLLNQPVVARQQREVLEDNFPKASILFDEGLSETVPSRMHARVAMSRRSDRVMTARSEIEPWHTARQPSSVDYFGGHPKKPVQVSVPSFPLSGSNVSRVQSMLSVGGEGSSASHKR